MSPAAFHYQPRNENAWKKRSEQSGSKFAGYILDDFKTFTPHKGENWVRIMPPTWENAEHYGMDIWVHYSVGPEDGAVLCLYKMKGEKCPICEEHQRAEGRGQENAKELKPGRRVLIYLVDKKAEKDVDIPQPWAAPWTWDKDVAKVCRDRISGELFQIDNPTAGFDVFFDKEGEKLQSKYLGFSLARTSSPVSQVSLDYVVKNPLPTVLQWRNYDEVKALFEGEAVKAPGEAAAVSHAPGQASNGNVCGHQMTYRGERLACGLPPGHQTDHDYSLTVEEGPANTQSAAPPPPPPPPIPQAVLSDFPPDGWLKHPAAPGYFYKGQEVLSEVDLRARMPHDATGPLPPPPPPVPPVITQTPQATAAASKASAIRERFQTGAVK